MSDITELERRITAALDRIGAGLEAFDTASQAEADPKMQADLDAAKARVAELEQALEDEKLAAAQLEERVKSIREKSERQASAMDIQLYEQQQATARLDSELQRLRRAAEDLRNSNLTLRDALEAGIAEPHLINKAMLSELETLRATRAVEAAQADAILASLDPLVKRAAQESDEADSGDSEKESADA